MSLATDIKKDFPLLEASPIAYLDNAASSQTPQLVIDAITNYYTSYRANVHRGLYDLSEVATVAYEAARVTTQQFINAEHAEEIVFTSGTTAGLNMLAHSLGSARLSKDDVILLSPIEHHSNLVPWQQAAAAAGATLEYFALTSDGEVDVEQIQSAFHDKVKIVTLSHISNASGHIQPVEHIIALAHQQEIPVVIDGAQSVPHQGIDVQDLDCDFLVWSGHKMCGPTGTGVVYGKRKWLEQLPPWQTGGSMIKEVKLESSTWASLPDRFEAGTPNIAGVIGLAAAIDYLQAIDMDVVQEQTEHVYSYLINQLTELDVVTVLGTEDRSHRSSIASFTLDGVHPHDVAEVLNQEQVAVRAGHHCAQPLMDYWGVPATARASVYFYNTEQDIDKLVNGLKKAHLIFLK